MLETLEMHFKHFKGQKSNLRGNKLNGRFSDGVEVSADWGSRAPIEAPKHMSLHTPVHTSFSPILSGTVDRHHAYSGLQNRCNVWEFWTAGGVAPVGVEIMLSAREME